MFKIKRLKIKDEAKYCDTYRLQDYCSKSPVRDQENKREKDLVKILESFVIPHERHES